MPLSEQIVAIGIFVVPAVFLLLLPREERARQTKGRSVFALGWNTRLGWAFGISVALFAIWITVIRT